MLSAVDESVGRIFKVLEDANQLADTLIIFTSDEGYFYGEHGLSVERRLSYEESARIPLFMRYPKMIKPASTIGAFALNIDIAPTLLEIGGAPIPQPTHGRSLAPLLRGEKVPWRNSFLIEYFSDTVFPRMLKMGYQTVRADRWKYIHYVDLEAMDELYDLKNDPFELKNRIHDPAAANALGDLKSELQLLLENSR